MLHRTEMLLKTFCDKHQMNYVDFCHEHHFLCDVDGRFSLVINSLSEDLFIIYLHVEYLPIEDIRLSASLLGLNMAYIENDMATVCLDVESRSLFLVKTQSLDGFDVNAFEALLSTLCMQGDIFQEEYATIKSEMPIA